MYILPHYRFTSYAIGIFTGFALTKVRDIKISSTYFYFAWTLTFTVLVICFRLAAELTDSDYKYSAVHAAAATLLPIPWCFFFVLVIFTAEVKISSNFQAQNSKIFINFFPIFCRSSNKHFAVEGIQNNVETFLQLLPRAVCCVLF